MSPSLVWADAGGGGDELSRCRHRRIRLLVRDPRGLIRPDRFC